MRERARVCVCQDLCCSVTPGSLADEQIFRGGRGEGREQDVGGGGDEARPSATRRARSRQRWHRW